MKKFLVVAALLVGQVAFGATQVRRSFVEKTFSPATSTSPAYSIGDQIGGVSTLSGVPQDAGGFATLWGVTVADADKTGQPFDLLFFNASPTDGFTNVDNAAVALGRVDGQDKLVGVYHVPSQSQAQAATTTLSGWNPYTTVGAVSVFTAHNIGLPLKVASNSGSSLYVVAVAKGVPTFTAASNLKVKMYFGQE